jgi:hypothetical protein
MCNFLSDKFGVTLRIRKFSSSGSFITFINPDFTGIVNFFTNLSQTFLLAILQNVFEVRSASLRD